MAASGDSRTDECSIEQPQDSNDSTPYRDCKTCQYNDKIGKLGYDKSLAILLVKLFVKKYSY